MGAVKTYAIGIGAVAVALVVAAAASAAAPVELRESARVKPTTRVTVNLKAEGKYNPAGSPGTTQPAKPLALRVESELVFIERVMATDQAGRGGRSVRRVTRAASAVNGEVRSRSESLRAEVALLVAEVNALGDVVVYSPLGPLTRSELEIVQGPGDPLSLGGLLPTGPVAVGARWKVGDASARALSGYDVVSSNGLEATLESADAARAKVWLRGELRGSALGGEGTMACDGSFHFDRKGGLIDRLALDRAETRRPGPVEGGLDIKSTLTVTRSHAEVPAELAEATLDRVVLNPGAGREDLLLNALGRKYSLRHDRDWHTFWDDPRLTVLKRVEGGRTVAQCNLAVGPKAGKGKHQDPSQFRDDVRKGLGSRFVQFLGSGDVEGDAAGGFRYKVGVQGRQGDLPVVWFYYLIAGPEGDQLLATFTLAGAQAQAFGDRDESLIGTLHWLGAEGEK